jgi:hypothetical protein
MAAPKLNHLTGHDQGWTRCTSPVPHTRLAAFMPRWLVVLRRG